MQFNSKIVFIIIIFVSGFGYSLNAQSFGTNRADDDDTQTEVKLHQEEAFKPNVTLNLGTSFMSYAPGYNTFGTFIAPEISMPVSNKVEISVGMGYSSIFNSSPGVSAFSNSPSNYGSLYVSGTYHLNEKLSFKGTAYKTFLLNEANFGESNGNNAYMDFSNQGVILDVEYRVTENFRINASFQYRDQNQPNYFGNYQNGFGSPMNQNPGFGGVSGFGPGF